jgi:plasmid rolling circle replication initiator protein Rep
LKKNGNARVLTKPAKFAMIRVPPNTTTKKAGCVHMSIITQNESSVNPLEKNIILSDKSASGRENPWRQKKMENERMADAYNWIDENTDCGVYWRKKAARLENCATQLYFDIIANVQTGEARKRLKAGNFCRVRLCPMCAWRRARKIQAQMYKICSAVQAEKSGSRWLFLTLTVPNCRPDELSATLDAMFAAWHRLRNFPEYKQLLGWYRALEITHNLRNNSYHPHFHCILCVPASYFSSGYVAHERWLAMWRQAMGMPEITQVDIRAVRRTQDTNALLHALAEVCKYTVKPAQLLEAGDMEYTAEMVQILDAALDKRRLVAYGGVLKDWHRKLNLDDAVDGDLSKAAEEAPTPEEMIIGDVAYIWHSGYSQYIGK